MNAAVPGSRVSNRSWLRRPRAHGVDSDDEDQQDDREHQRHAAAEVDVDAASLEVLEVLRRASSRAPRAAPSVWAEGCAEEAPEEAPEEAREPTVGTWCWERRGEADSWETPDPQQHRDNQSLKGLHQHWSASWGADLIILRAITPTRGSRPPRPRFTEIGYLNRNAVRNDGSAAKHLPARRCGDRLGEPGGRSDLGDDRPSLGAPATGHASREPREVVHIYRLRQECIDAGWSV